MSSVVWHKKLGLQAGWVWLDRAAVPFPLGDWQGHFPISFLVACFDSSNPGLCDI